MQGATGYVKAPQHLPMNTTTPRDSAMDTTSTTNAQQPVPVPAIAELVQVHECLRVEVKQLRRCAEAVQSSVGHPHQWGACIQALTKQFDLLYVVYHAHSQAEDDVVLPALTRKGLSHEVFASLTTEHSGHDRTFESLLMLLIPLRGVAALTLGGKSEDLVGLVREIAELVDRLGASLNLHLRHEEEEVFPLLHSHFSRVELREMIGSILGNRSSQLLQVYVDMLARDLNAEETKKAVDNLRDACTGTQFDVWLQAVVAKSNNTIAPLLAPPPRSIPITATPPQSLAAAGPASPAAATAAAASSCVHYQRNCDIITPCCSNQAFACRLCHDDEAVRQASLGQAKWHTLDRTTVTHMRCRLCSTLQPVSQSCVSCHEQMAEYYCTHCKLFDSTPGKHIYHCQYCNICRIGQGLGKDFFHCMKCNACISVTARDHKCLEHMLESDCAICGDFLFTSERDYHVPALCQHVMHRDCFTHFSAHDFKCPTCRRSVTDMRTTWQALDATAVPAGPHLASPTVTARCLDCTFVAVPTLLHLHFNVSRCDRCGSYNTEPCV